MRKLERFDITDNETGELIEGKIIHDLILDEERIRRGLLKKKAIEDPDSMSLSEIEEYLGSRNKIKLDFKEDGFFSVKVNDFTLELNIRTRGLLFTIGEFMTNEGRILYRNSKPVKSLNALRILTNISVNDWKKYVKPDIDKYKLIKKEKIDGVSYFIPNPLFLFKDRVISETMFIAYHKELKERLSYIEYLYLYKKHGIDVG